MFVGSVMLTLLLAQYVPSSIERTDVADHPTIVGWIEMFAFMLLFLWTMVSLVAIVLFGFVEIVAYFFRCAFSKIHVLCNLCFVA
jgi:hypothetical protein